MKVTQAQILESETKVTCPYCGLTGRYTVEIKIDNLAQALLLYCESEAGGCDKRFALVGELTFEGVSQKLEN